MPAIVDLLKLIVGVVASSFRTVRNIRRDDTPEQELTLWVAVMVVSGVLFIICLVGLWFLGGLIHA